MCRNYQVMLLFCRLRENVLPEEVAKQVKADEDIARAREFEAEREKRRLQKVS